MRSVGLSRSRSFCFIDQLIIGKCLFNLWKRFFLGENGRKWKYQYIKIYTWSHIVLVWRRVAKRKEEFHFDTKKEKFSIQNDKIFLAKTLGSTFFGLALFRRVVHTPDINFIIHVPNFFNSMGWSNYPEKFDMKSFFFLRLFWNDILDKCSFSFVGR